MRKFHIEEKWPGIYYISKEGFIRIQIIVSRKLSQENHIWLNSLSENIGVKQVTELIGTMQDLEELDEQNYADSLWEIVATVNEETIQKVREEESMACKAVEDMIIKPKIEKAFNDGFNDGFDNGSNDKGINVFKNMIKDGMSRELAQKYAEISDQLAEKALAEI